MICLDTNAAIAILRGKPPALLDRVRVEAPRNELALSAIALFELQYGVAKSPRRMENAERLKLFLRAPIAILPFDAEDAEEAGDIRAELQRKGKPIGPYDLLIAAQARRRSALLVTANTREFSRVPKLMIENWEKATLPRPENR
ncbi:MAG: type II toxin-antitoxin system VapC family toxin [Parvibaculaceae bacterium]